MVMVIKISRLYENNCKELNRMKEFQLRIKDKSNLRICRKACTAHENSVMTSSSMSTVSGI